MHDPVRVPETVGAGDAKLVVSFDDWKEGKVASSESQLSIVAPPREVKLEATSPRLRQTLVHPDKSGMLLSLHFTPDGRRIFAGHDLSGIVQIWDAISGRQIQRIETGEKRNHHRDFLQPSPDGKLLYVDKGSLISRSIKKDGKRLAQWDCSGEVQAWDLATGHLRLTIRQPPPRGIFAMRLSADGSTLLTTEAVSGEYERGSNFFAVLWDAKSGRKLLSLEGQNTLTVNLSPDAKTLVTDTVNDNREATAFRLLDATSGRVRLTVPLKEEHLRPSIKVFSPDGKLLAGALRNAQTGVGHLVLWDAETGRQTTSFQVQNQGVLLAPLFSPDGQKLLLFNWGVGPRKCLLIDVARRRLLKTLDFGDKGSLRQPIFSPDGKWIAAIFQEVPERVPDSKMQDVALLPQPRIHLIETATGEVRETIVAPPGVAVSLCFSPDGKTLASGGDGRVLLWDMTNPPGMQSSSR